MCESPVRILAVPLKILSFWPTITIADYNIDFYAIRITILVYHAM